MEWIIVKSEYPVEIVKFIEDVFELVEIRGRVGNKKGIVFYIRSNETNHSIPHLHAQYGEYNISIAINTCEVLAGNLPSKQISIAKEWVFRHKEDLLTKWNELSINAISSMTVSKINE